MADRAEENGRPTIGAAVRAARLAAGLSVSELARRVGVSQPYVSQIESGRHTPSAATLYKLADVLQVTTGALLPSAGVPGGPTLVRAGDGTPVPFDVGRRRLEARYLGSGGGSDLSPLRFVLPPGYRDPEPYVHAGELFVLVVSGRLAVRVGSEDFELGPGDSLHHDARQPHSWAAVGPESTELVLVETTHRFASSAVRRAEGEVHRGETGPTSPGHR